jgi:hypothetical protein
MKHDDDSLDLLVQKLRWLRLPGMARSVSSLLEQATNDNLTDLEILHRLCDEERASRMKSAVDRRVKDAKFPELNTVDGFDFDFDPVRKKLRARYLALHDLTFLLAVAWNRGKLDRRDHVAATSRSDRRGSSVTGGRRRVDDGDSAVARTPGPTTTPWAWGGAAAFQPGPRDGGSSRLRWR